MCLRIYNLTGHKITQQDPLQGLCIYIISQLNLFVDKYKCVCIFSQLNLFLDKYIYYASHSNQCTINYVWVIAVNIIVFLIIKVLHRN